jgi:signal recognition particle subunit SRP54
MIGQEAVRVAEEFNRRVELTGVVMTKVDGDARGGAALSVRAVTGVPIKFLSAGEKVSDDTIEAFHPDRLASRILGMGDVLSLIERAEQIYDEDQARKMEKKLRKGSFDFEDFLGAMQQMRKLGPLQQILAMIPGMGQIARDEELVSEKDLKRIEAIICRSAATPTSSKAGARNGSPGAAAHSFRTSPRWSASSSRCSG